MAPRDQDQMMLVVLGVVVVGLMVVMLVFGVANGVASGIAGFLHKSGLPKDMAMDVYRTIRWAVVGAVFFGGAVAGIRALID